MATPNIKAKIIGVRADFFGHISVCFDIVRVEDETLINRFEVRMPHREYSDPLLLEQIKSVLKELREHLEDEEDPKRNVEAIKTDLVGMEIPWP